MDVELFITTDRQLSHNSFYAKKPSSVNRP